MGRHGLRWVGKGRAHLGRLRLGVITESRQEMVVYATVGAVGRLGRFWRLGAGLDAGADGRAQSLSK